MSQTLKPYAEYKESCLPWLGKIPVHWTEKRAKYFFREVDERSITGQEEMLSVSHITGVTLRSQKNVTMFKAESNVGHKLCHAGDLVINTMWAWMAALGVAKQTGVVSPSYAVYRPIRANAFVPEYIDHLLRTKPYATEYLWRSTGIRSSRLRLYPEKFLEIPIICPPCQEQIQMLAFLNATDQLIRRYIRAKRQLIKLHNEQMQAIILHAVTRGLDPNVLLKPSGVEWLGDIPEHWNLMPLKYLSLRVQNGATPPTGEFSYYENGDIPWYGPSSIGNDIEIGAPVKFLNTRAFVDGKARKVKGPAILVVVIGTAGRMALLNADGSTNQQITSFEIDSNRVLALFAAFQFKQAEPWLRASASSATIPILDSCHLSRSILALPNIKEQKRIISSLDEEIKPYKATISCIQREIDLIREYHTILINSVATGKLDFRSFTITMRHDEDVVEVQLAEDEELDEEEVMEMEVLDDADD